MVKTIRTKIYDILPPRTKKESLKAKEIIEKKVVKKSKGARSLFLMIALLSLIFIVILTAVLTFTLARAEIAIWPKISRISLEEQFTVSKDQKESDFIKKLLPAQIISNESKLTEKFQTTGKVTKEEKAEGIIRVYNAYSTSSQPLIANTRFVSAEGKLFRTVQREVIPGGKLEKGKLVPGEIDIKIRADQPGEDYNIGSSTFSIPGFLGTAKYTAFYGKSFESMAGGRIAEVKVVTQQDLDKAKDSLTKKLLEDSKAALLKRLPQDFILVDEKAISQEIKDVLFSVQEGKEADSFTAEIKIKSEAIGFLKSDLENLAEKIILAQFPGEKEIYKPSLMADWSLDTLNPAEGKLIINVNFSAKVYTKINLTNLKNEVAGKEKKELELLLESLPDVEKTQLKIRPFWIRRVPKDSESIEIKLFVD